MVSAKLFCDKSMERGLGQSREHTESGTKTGEKDSRERNADLMALKFLLTDWGATSVSHLRWVFSSAVFRSYFLILLKYSESS